MALRWPGLFNSMTTFDVNLQCQWHIAIIEYAIAIADGCNHYGSLDHELSCAASMLAGRLGDLLMYTVATALSAALAIQTAADRARFWTRSRPSNFSKLGFETS